MRSIVATATAEKAEARIMVKEETLKVGNALYAIAIAENNEKLLSQAKITMRTLQHLSERNMLVTARKILSLARTHASRLVRYGIDNRGIDQHGQAIDAFERQRTLPRKAIAERKSVTVQLTVLFDSTRTLLKDRLDKIMSLFQASHHDFYAAYFNARRITSTAAPKEKTGEQQSFAEADDSEVTV